MSLTRKDQLAVSAALKQKHAPEEESEPDDAGKKPRKRRGKNPKGKTMKKPAASARMKKPAASTGKGTREMKEPKTPKGKAKALAKQAETSEEIPKTTGSKRKANAESAATSTKPSTKPSTSKRSKTTKANEKSNTRAVKATFARRWPPNKEPSLSFHNALRAAFESEVEGKVKTPSKLEETLVSCVFIHLLTDHLFLIYCLVFVLHWLDNPS